MLKKLDLVILIFTVWSVPATTVTTTADTTTAGTDGLTSFVIVSKYINDIYRYNYEEGTKTRINFDQSGHSVYKSCSVNYKGEVWIFGGNSYDNRKVSTVSNCALNPKSIILPEIGINI